eukprot:11173046-Lingulodinium_polyedra.AAC.1
MYNAASASGGRMLMSGDSSFGGRVVIGHPAFLDGLRLPAQLVAFVGRPVPDRPFDEGLLRL